jgi:hypothetical protein
MRDECRQEIDSRIGERVEEGRGEHVSEQILGKSSVEERHEEQEQEQELAPHNHNLR